MVIYLYDGRIMPCSNVYFNKTSVIVDGKHNIKLIEILRIETK